MLSDSFSDSSSSWTSEDSSISGFSTDSDSDVESPDDIGLDLGQGRQLERSTNSTSSVDLYEHAHVSVLEYCFLVMQYALR